MSLCLPDPSEQFPPLLLKNLIKISILFFIKYPYCSYDNVLHCLELSRSSKAKGGDLVLKQKKKQLKGIINIPNSSNASCSNSSLLESSPPTTEARVRAPTRTCQSLWCSSRRWRWPWSSLSLYLLYAEIAACVAPAVVCLDTSIAVHDLLYVNVTSHIAHDSQSP